MINLLYEPYRRHFPAKTSKLHNAFMHVRRPYKTQTICLKLFKHWSEPIVKIEAYHLMTMRLLWLPFNDRYMKFKYNVLKQGQITSNIENKYALKLINMVAQCSKIINIVLLLNHVLHDFCAFSTFE